MHRRDVLRLLATGSLLHLAPPHLLAALREARGLIQSQNSPRTLSPHQYGTVKAMAELIIPRTDTPGAADVGVADFIDLMLTEWYDETDRTRFLSGLAGVDSRSHAQVGKDFVDCSSREQSDIMVGLGKDMAEAKGQNESLPDWLGSAPMSFYGIFRELTLTGYYTSEAGATQELHFEMIPDRYDGCPTEPIKQAQERR
ncbi:MAG TPA: gluconate 2-dehydrogenase subunit 3 family protein [Candidatus Sulfotelmatobacter sp.]|nr:gluconate 2-dehydrogenase subunit 3 family protein [Candidatus Sulfotelmatobacter sp.]